MTDDRVSTASNLGTSGDDVYAELMAAHDGLSDEESVRLNVRLVLLLINHIGDRRVIEQMIVTAKAGSTSTSGS